MDIGAHYRQQLDDLRKAGLEKAEMVINSPQRAHLEVCDRGPMLNMCANNYLGLADHPDLIAAAAEGLRRWGFGMASVRFICGTQVIHHDLEAAVSRFLGTEQTLLYSSCFDANAGLFETLLGPDDAIVSDELNHASIIDGIRLCKARRYRYRNSDMNDLESQLRDARAAGAGVILIATDGVFSMDGRIANLPAICDLADRFGALIMVDDSHATGIMGARGRGTHEHHGVLNRIDILTGTFGKALGGAGGGYVAGRKDIINLLRQRSRPYLFSNSLIPAVAAANLAAIRLVENADDLRRRLWENTRYFRQEMVAAGFDIIPGDHPIVPIMFGDANLAVNMARKVVEKGVFVVAFAYPVVPMGKARIRIQVSAAHSRDDLQRAIASFVSACHETGK
ncbi:MAG: glycine C-acetyltransferase [Phycisphaerae bacterium]